MNKWCSIKSKKQPQWNLVLQWTDGANASDTFHRAANERSSLTSDSLSVSPTRPSCRYTNIAHYTRFNVLHIAADPPPASGRRHSPALPYLRPIDGYYQCCSKLQQLWGAVGEIVSPIPTFSLPVPRLHCSCFALPPLPPPPLPADCPINQFNLLNVFFCLRMHIS